MDTSKNEKTLGLFDLVKLFLKSWKIFTTTFVLSVGIGITLAFTSPKVFQAKTVVVTAQEERNDPPFLLGEIEGLAAMAGITIPYNSNTKVIIETIKSRKFISDFLANHKIDFGNMSLVKDFDSFEMFYEKFSIFHNQKSDVLELSLEWHDKNKVADYLNSIVIFTNLHFRNKAIEMSKKRMLFLEKELAKTKNEDMKNVLFKSLAKEKQKSILANVNEYFALEVIDPAVAPKNHFKPRRKYIVFMSGVAGLLLGFFFLLGINLHRNLN